MWVVSFEDTEKGRFSGLLIDVLRVPIVGPWRLTELTGHAKESGESCKGHVHKTLTCDKLGLEWSVTLQGVKYLRFGKSLVTASRLTRLPSSLCVCDEQSLMASLSCRPFTRNGTLAEKIYVISFRKMSAIVLHWMQITVSLMKCWDPFATLSLCKQCLVQFLGLSHTDSTFFILGIH